ncbi:autotransporter outer membrane beta-barrel domain-containing protein [Sphingomonas sp. 3-13AW]|uniref:autotransporter outer membrane beta-barrel domain-containing protein n=1 Tax=Sphingomonas sp. 3-13AW TaxID=3050450 RepID=UPI003BB78E24
MRDVTLETKYGGNILLSAFKYRRIALFTSVAFLSGAPALAEDYIVPPESASATQVTVGGTDTVTVAPGGTLSVRDTAIRWGSASTDLRITNSGTIESTASGGRAIDAGGSATEPRVITLTNGEGAVITSENDAVRINVDITAGSVTLSNAGTIVSTVEGQALDFDAVASIGVGAISITNEATGVIRSTDADGVRPGAGAVVRNFGLIAAGGATSRSSDGIDWQGHSGTVINEVGGTIEGARHAITTDIDVLVRNYGTIIGRNGSGVGSDGIGTVYNYGTIIGSYNGSGLGDGDGVDIDYYGIVYNNGLIEGVGAAGGPLDDPNSSEGLALTDGGIVYNDVNGVIRGADVGVSAYQVFSPTAAYEITNKGIIYGGNHGVGGNGEATLVNYGSITGGVAGMNILNSIHGATDWFIDNHGTIGSSNRSFFIQSNASLTVRTQSGSALSGAIGLDGRLNLDTPSDFTFSDTISGAGQLVKSGDASLTLTGTNTYTGGTIVNGGTLKGSTTALQGAILNNATVEFDQATDGTYRGTMSGSGVLIKSGAGTLNLTGTHAVGATTVAAGTLGVRGSLSTDRLAVTSGGILGGTGRVIGAVTVADGGTLSPGNSIGTLTVDGSVTLAPGASTIVEIDNSAAGAPGSHDQILVNGTFTAGGTLRTSFNGTDAASSTHGALGRRYGVVTADAVSGRFATIATSGLSDVLRADALYFPTEVQLVLTPASFAALGTASGWNGNTLAAASALDLIRDDAAAAPLFSNLYGLDAGGYGSSIRSLAGQIYADGLQSAASAARATLGVVRDQALHLGIHPDDGVQIWGRYVHSAESPDASAVAAAYKANTNGFVAGLTLINERGLRFGLAGGYTETRVNSATGASADGSTGAGYVYSAYSPSAKLNVTGVLAYARTKLDITRAGIASTGDFSAQGRAKMRAIQFSVDARYQAVQAGELALNALAGVEGGLTRSARITETAGNSAFALNLPRNDWNTVDARLGGELVQGFKDVRLSAYGNWLVKIGDSPTASREVELAGGRWSVRSTGLAKSGIGYGAAITGRVLPRLSLQASYDGADRGKGFHNDRFSAGASLAF